MTSPLPFPPSTRGVMVSRAKISPDTDIDTDTDLKEGWSREAVEMFHNRLGDAFQHLHEQSLASRKIHGLIQELDDWLRGNLAEATTEQLVLSL